MSQFNYPSNNLGQALDAIITLNSGASEPPATAPYMLWMDTSKTPAVMRQRNGDDTGWIDLFAANAVAAVPVGTVNAIAGAAIPDGWLECDGAEVSRTQYADLFGQIGTIYGVGDGSSTFNLPDLRGEFIRGLDNGRGVDASRALGSEQGDAIRNITGRWKNSQINTLPGNAIPENSGVFSKSGSYAYKYDGGARTISEWMNFDVSTQVPTAEENRPRNVAMKYIIKY
ncbi:phage tail protein [Salidesulfovibrio onnuriiensis]|uniref:phage tail protein n=1 Tax=Salidesulfovibrio onnuriiensis TaxID=2583823 RepID=UPI0011C92D79|nr:tail fiber protein [Salidesulfovibrio onnuriiensis]